MDDVLYLDKRDKVIKVRRGLEDYTLQIPNTIITKILNTQSINYTSSADRTKEYRVIHTLSNGDSFPLFIKYSFLTDVYGNKVPATIENAFIVGLQPINYRRDFYILSYTDTGFTVDMGVYGEPVPDTFKITFIIKEG